MIEHRNALKERAIEKARIFDMKVLTWYFAIISGLMTLTNKFVIRFQDGNKKLAADDAIAFIVFSLPAVLTCPGATLLCMRNCYARRDERFIGARTGRIINYLISKRDDFESVLYTSIHNKIYTKKGDLRKKYRGKEIVFRIHESGDFYSERYMRAWFKVAAMFPDVTFFAYTKSFRTFDRCADAMPKNFTMRASVWADTTAVEWGLIAKNHMPIYTAYDEHDFNVAVANGGKECTCESCTKCGCACARRENETMVTRIH